MSSDGTRRDGASVKVLVKAVDVLECVKRNGGMSAAELAETLELPRSTVYRLLGALEGLELVQDLPGNQGRYTLGQRMIALGGAALENLDVRAAALPIMEMLSSKTGHSSWLCVRRGDAGLCIASVGGRWVQSMVLGVGGSHPLHIGAGPRVLLAYQAEAFWDMYCQRNRLVSETTEYRITKKKLVGELRAIRADGIVTSVGHAVPGMAALGVPIFAKSQGIHAALSLGGPTPMLTGEHWEALASAIGAAGMRISKALGAESEGARTAPLGR